MADPTIEKQWRVRSHWPSGQVTEAYYSERRHAEIETYLRQRYSDCKVELLQWRTITTTPWKLLEVA
jgi:hypothetical protein